MKMTYIKIRIQVLLLNEDSRRSLHKLHGLDCFFRWAAAAAATTLRTRRRRGEFIWLYCSHCAYCRSLQKVLLQWHLLAALGHCNSANQLSLWPGQDGSVTVLVYFLSLSLFLTIPRWRGPHFPSPWKRWMFNQKQYTKRQTGGQTNHFKNAKKKGSAN